MYSYNQELNMYVLPNDCIVFMCTGGRQVSEKEEKAQKVARQ